MQTYLLAEVRNAWSRAFILPYAIIACTGIIFPLVWLIGHGCFQTLSGFPAAEACVSSCLWQDSTMEHSAMQARFGLSLSLILTAGGGPSSAGREEGERITPYVIMTQNVTDGPTYCLV